MSYQICGACFGTCKIDGKINGKPCPRCDGTGRVPGPKRVKKLEEARVQRKSGYTDLDDHLDWLRKSVDRMERAKKLPEPERQRFLVIEAAIALKRARELLNLLKGKASHDKGKRCEDQPQGNDQDKTDQPAGGVP